MVIAIIVLGVICSFLSLVLLVLREECQALRRKDFELTARFCALERLLGLSCEIVQGGNTLLARITSASEGINDDDIIN